MKRDDRIETDRVLLRSVEVNAQHTWGISTSVEYKGLMWLTREIPVVYGVYFEALCAKKVFKSEPKLDF